ncbi:hypothetical protein EZJ43_07790 [Pedobacter changchengzhani]|uniref:Uncharacterized protein n=1 Tax=Pedobacter changchengzhani TaxID=2529274 RepID=A0A4R5ML65_9SPHI|nr:hypothetical protein [Pedobacter changchengzhani]TDG36411.1 hypothetical protein EZJ43_07790 [Pedobacter changchengzhani]
MLTKNPEQRTETLTKQIPALGKIPYEQRLIVFNQAFKSTSYKIFLALILIAFILVFYFNLDSILAYKGLERGGLFARSIHFLKELGTRFFIPLMAVMLALVLGRNYFVKLEVEKYLEKNHK